MDEEIEIQIKKMKKKTVGVDRIENKARLYSGGQIKKKLKELMKKM